jgi:hypothetical protein
MVLEFMRDDSPRQRRIAVLRAQRLSPARIAKLEAEALRGRRRVTELIDCLRLLFGRPFREAPEGPEQVKDTVGREMNRCNRLLVRYKVRWLLGPAWSGGGIGPLEENLGRATFGFVELVAPGANVTAEECHAVRAVMKLTELGALQKLRKCKECGNWLYARFEHQQFCAKRCQIKHNASSEQWKEYKRNKAREYYHLHKTGKVRERAEKPRPLQTRMGSPSSIAALRATVSTTAAG